MKPQRPLLGFSLALLTAMMWGSVPIAAQKVLSVVNAQTLVWARFIVAAIGLLLILGFTKKLPKHQANLKTKQLKGVRFYIPKL